ncbi:titin isoform X3 [Solenopsis invicta]|uniref:titin isoform X3 n=1 Tax=Solenopsis invicta TaxID=13686 RepID=UPI00193CE54D|nr:titin isoform X3 [Solenopsis invicta]
MTLTDTLKNKGPPEWIEEDEIVLVQGHVGEDIIIELKLALCDNYDDLRFELIRDGLPVSSDRYQLSIRSNVVQLALKQSRKNDTGYYSLVATRLEQENDKGALKKIHLSISERSYEEGDPPVFLRRLSDLEVKVGTRTRFLVEIQSSTTLKITWYKDDLPIHDGHRFFLVHEGNFHCVDVAPVTVDDQGSWTCMAENHSGRSSCTSTLTVIVPRAYKKPEFVEELRALLTETGTVSLECKVIGVPTPVLKWFKDNKEIKAGDVFALTANPDDPTSLGVYTCEAVNCMGTAYSSSKVHVVGRGSREGSLKPADALAPSGLLPIFKQMLQDECCRIGDSIVLSCRVQVPPWPKAITWYNKEGRVEPSEKYHVIEDGIGGYSIEIKQVEAMDEGEWKCVASSEDNMKQFTSCYVAMSIPRNYRKPRFMENLKAVLTEEGLVSFECKVVGFPTPWLRWFKDGQELKPGDVYQLTGTNSLGSYCCIARNCMGEAKSTAELTIEDIQNQLNEEERFQLLSSNQPPKFIKGLRSCEARINEDFCFTIQVSIAPEPTLSWYRNDALMDESDKYHIVKENLGTCHFEVHKLEFVDQAEWKCVAANDFGHSVTSCFLKLVIPKHYKKPKFLENLRAVLSEEGAVNLECKVIGVPQPVLKWYKDNAELKPGDIHRIISGQDGTCCLGIYTCEAINCMGTVSSSASLLGFEDKKNAKDVQLSNDHELARNLSLSTIHEERTSQLYDTPQTDYSVTLDERGEVSFSFDGKEVSVSLYETPDLTEEEALQIVEMYADQLSEHVTEHNVIELPPMRFVKETSTTSNLLMEAIVIDVSPDYFISAEDGDDLRTEADFEDVSIMDDVTRVFSSPERDSRSSLKRSARFNTDEDEKIPNRPPRKKSMSLSLSKSDKSQRIESESFHSAQKDEPPLSPLSSLKQDDSDTFADALSSAHVSITESLIQKHVIEQGTAENRKRSLSAGRSTGSSLDDGIGGDSSFDSTIGVPKIKQRKKKQQMDKNNFKEYSDPDNYEQRKRNASEDKVGLMEPIEKQLMESVEKTEIDNGNETKAVKKLFTEEKLLENLKSIKEVNNSNVSEEIQESTKDILLESKTALRSSLKLFYEKVLDTAPQFSNIYEQIEDIHQLLEVSRGIDANIQTLANLEIPMRTLLKEINEITLTEYVEIIHNILEPSIIQLSHIIENLGLLSLQPTHVILKKFSDPVSIATKELSPIKSTSDKSQNISEEIVDPLIDIQSMFNGILDYIEQLKLKVNGSASPQVLTASGLIPCLVELRECISHTAHTAMTFKENETINSLMEFQEPLLDLQLILASQKCTLRELSMIKKINLIIVKLKNVVIIILKNSKNHEVTSRVEAILKILEDTNKQISKLIEQLSETEMIQKHTLKNLNIDQSLSNVYFALSSILEKQKEHLASHYLITSIEALRQIIGSSAVTIANLKNPTDNEIIQEISKLNKSLLNLKKNLLTEKHESQEEQVINDLMNSISILKEVVRNVIKNSSSIESIMPLLELLEDIEKDATLIVKEISKKKESITQSLRENTEEKSNSKSNLANQIGDSLNLIKNWLSDTSKNSTLQYKDEMEFALSSTVEELKKNINQIAILTSYSELPSDESLINALIDLREPLIKLKNSISTQHQKPENLSILENLNHPMKCLLQITRDVFCEHTEEESLRPMIDTIEQIKNQIPLLIKNILYQQELKENIKVFEVETEEEIVTSSHETIPGIRTEVVSTPLEAGSIVLLTEQAITENNYKNTTDNVVLQSIKNEKEEQEREESANKLIMILSETLEKLQLEVTSILEDFEESTTQTTTIPQSKLANSVEELRKTISTIRVMIVYGEETGSFEKKLNQTILVFTNLMEPLTNIRNLLSKSHEHDVSELMILNRFIPLMNIIENDMGKRIIDFVSTDKSTEKKFDCLLCMVKEIKTKIPIVIEKISLKRKILEYLWDISKPLESILDRMNDLEKAAEETLETDVANILAKPIAAFLEDIKITTQEIDLLDQRQPLILELWNLVEPLLEFHSCLSMVQSSRRSLVPEASLLDERRSVILRAIDDLRKQVCHTIEVIANNEEVLFNETLTLLNSAILQVQKQIGKTDYSRRSSSTNISLQHRLTDTLNRLDNAIVALEQHADKDTYRIVSKCLEALQKQISFAKTQFNQIGTELIDEEAIVEGFLYPTNQLLSALNILKENMQKIRSAISPILIVQFQELADSISELSFSLLAHKTVLVQEGASEKAPIVETFSAVIDVLDHVKDSINVIKQTVDEQKASMIITKVESVIDEIIEVSQEEIESVTMITEIPSSRAIIQEVVQSEDTFTMQTPVLQNLETVISVEQTENDLMDIKIFKENEEEHKEENKRQKYLTEISKFNSVISNLRQPLKELINFVNSAKQLPLISKSEENKRKIQELTALIQILNDLQATISSIKTVITSSSIILLDNQFSRMEDTFTDFQQAISTVISLTCEGIKPELKETIMASLPFISKPLDALKNILASVCQTIEEEKYINKNGESSAIARALMSCINDTIKSLSEIQILKYVSSADDEVREIIKVKEEVKDIEETTARPLEELIEVIMESQEQVKSDKSLLLESSPPSMDIIESKNVDKLKLIETELNKTLVKETDVLMKQNTIETPQQALTSSLESSQIEDLLIKNAEEIKLVAESLKEVKEHNLVTVDQQKIESTLLSENSMIQKEQRKVETLQEIISSLQTLCKSFDKTEEVGVTEYIKKEKIVFSALIEPLLNLQLALSSKVTEDIKQNTMTSLKLIVVRILEELPKSIAIVQEQVQLNTAAETSLSKTSKMFSVQAIVKSLEDLRTSIACIQSDPIISQFIQQETELLNIDQSVEQITILQNLTKLVVQFGEKFMSIINQIKIQNESPLQMIKQEGPELDLEILQKIVDPIHILRETLSQIENFDSCEAELLEMPEKQKIKTVQLDTVIASLENLEKSLITGIQQNAITQEEVLKEFNENQSLLVSANLKPVIEKLRNSINIVQEQSIHNEDILVLKTLNEALENLKMPLTTIEEVFNNINEVTKAEKVSTLLSFANSIKKITNQLVVTTKQNIEKQTINETSLLKTMTIPIEELQSTILKLEDRLSQTLETKESIKAITLECMIQPLQELQQSFLTASYQETVLALQRLPIKPILDNLNKSVAMIQDQVMIIQDNLLVDMNTDDAITLKDFARSLGNLRTSMVVLQQLNAIENAGQQIVEIENASALQAFAKSIEEFKKCCSVIVERPRIIEAFRNAELKKSNKIDPHLIENIITPLRILQEQILTIEEIKTQESEIFDVSETRKPVIALSSLVGPLQQLEKSFIATVQKEHVIEHNGHNLITKSSVSLEKLALQPILEEVQKSIATVQEHVILEAESQITSEVETDTLLKSIAQPLIDLKASIASIQQITAIAPEFVNELVQQQNVSALETFAKTLHNLMEHIATCNHQQLIMEPADTISEDISSLSTWAEVIDEFSSKITRPMIIDQGVIESPVEIAMSMSEDETSMLKTLAKPLTELRECLALIVEQQKTILPYDSSCSLLKKENISLTTTIIQPLLELQHAAAIIIQEQMIIERANEHLSAINGKNEFILQPLVEPLEELRHSIAVIQDQILIETSTDGMKNDVILDALAEPLFDLQRAISVLETRPMSPDVESMSEDIDNNWITECLATPLHEIEKSIAHIRQCNIMEPETAIVEEQMRTSMPDRSIIEELAKPIESIKSALLCMKDDSIEIEILKMMEIPLTNVQENLTLLRNKYNIETVIEKGSVDAFIQSLSNFEECISFIKEELVDKPMCKQSGMMKIDTTISATLNIPLTELKCSIVNVKQLPSIYLNNLKGPLELVQNAFETIITIQRSKKLSELSTKIINNISDINKSIESIDNELKQQQLSVVEIYIEYEALEMLTKSLQNIKRCIIQIQKKPNTANLMISALQKLERSIAVMRQQSADKPLAESQHINFGIVTKNLISCLQELQESIETTKTLWNEETVLDGLMILEEPIYKLQTTINIMYNQFVNETISIINKYKANFQKSIEKKEMKASETETTVKKDSESNETIKAELEETEWVKDNDFTIINDMKDKENMKKLEETEHEKENKKLIELLYEEGANKIKNENKKEKKEDVIQEMQLVSEKQDSKEIETKEETEKIIKNGKKEQNKKEYKKIEESDSFEKHKEAEKRQEIKNQEEKIDTVQEKKKIDEYKRVEEIRSIKEEAKNEETKKSKDIGKKEEQKEKKDETDKIKKEQKDIKDNNKLKLIEQHKERDKTEENQEKVLNELQQKKQESIKTEKIELIQKENNKETEIKEIKKDIEHKILKEDEKLDKKQKNLEDIECTAQNQNEDIDKIKEENKKLKDQKTEKLEKKKVNVQEMTKEQVQNDQVEIKKDNQEEGKQEKKLDKKTMEKTKIKDDKGTENEKVEELEKKEKNSSEKEEIINQKVQKQKDEVKISKENYEEQKSTTKTEEKKEENQEKGINGLQQKKQESIKTEKIELLRKKNNNEAEAKEIKKDIEHKILKEDEKLEAIKLTEDKQAKTTKNVQEHEKTSAQEKNKMEDIKVEKIKIESIERKSDKIVKTGEIIQQKYICVNDIKKDDTDESKREYKKISKDQQLEQNQKEETNKEFQKLKESKNLYLQVQEDQRKQKNDRKQEEKNKSEFEELKELITKEESKQRKPHIDGNWLCTREKRIDRGSEHRIQEEENVFQGRNNNIKLHRMDTEYLEKKRIVRRAKEVEYVAEAEADEEKRQKRNEEKRIRREEAARLLWEEDQRLRKRQEEERFRNRQRRKEQIKDNEWSRKRENESDRFLRNMLETTYKPDQSTSMFFDVISSRERTFRFNSGIPILSSTSKSYSWRDSLTSLNRKRFDDLWDYKLRNPCTDKYHSDTGSLHRRRRRRENRMIRARSISLLKYEDYSTGDSDATIVPSMRIRPFRRIKEDFVDFDTHKFKSFNYTDLHQSESFLWNKPKKPSFCTRLTNRIVGVGMKIRLTCTVLGNPEPRIYWMKDDQKLDASHNRCRVRYENGMAYLELRDTLPEDAGVYTCVAENTHGTSTTESILGVYSDYKPACSPPIFSKSIKDTYRYSDRKLILECRVRAHPIPTISWLKNGKILQGERYKQIYLDDDVYRLEIADPDVTDNGKYTCRAVNELHTEELSLIVHVEDWLSIKQTDLHSGHKIKSDFAQKPLFSNILKDYSVPAGGTIALQVEVKGTPSPEVKWLRSDRKEPIMIPKAQTFLERGLYTLIVPEATESEKGTYVCRATNAYGQVDTSATVDVISSSVIDGGKPAVFVSRPSKKTIDVIVGEDISISFRVNGIPKPRIIWMKGLTDITDGPRSYKESIDDYVRLTLKNVIPSDEGTYCILVKNRYGCDRSFFSIKVKQRARSLTPLSDWKFVTDYYTEEYDNDMSYVRNVPGPISSEPVVTDGGKSWLSLSWGKAERRGPAPVVAYKVEAWLLGSDGGARWIELGVTPINAFDAFNLRPGGEYKFRVTPRNRYGWGEPGTMTNSVLMMESTDLPEFTKILPGQLKVLEGTSVKLECEIRGDSKMEARWFRETTEINPCNDTRFAIYYDGSKCSLTITNVKEDDSGRYVCEANNRIGKVSSFARILVVTDPRIIEADAKLKTNLSIEPEDRPPQFTMRIRDRRVQTTYPVRLTCQVIGHPIPEITWYKNETEISQDDRHIFWDDDSNFHTLEITHSALEDSGCYMVTARNINGSVSCRCSLVVDKGIRAYIAPEFLRGLDTAYTIHSGGELRMSAQLEAYPSVGVVWHRDGIRLRPSRRSIMTLSHDGTVQFSLINVTMRDAGVYSCTATNIIGQAETSTKVAVTTAIQDQLSINESSNIMITNPDILYSKEPLFVTKPLSTEAIEGDTVIILCEVVGDPKPEVIWLRDFLKPDYYKDAPHFRLVGAGPQYRLEIPYAKLDFTGTYSVIARNCHGEAKAVISLQIYAKEQGKEEQMQKSPHGKVLTLPIIKRELRDLRCCDGDAVSLECKVYATPEPPLVRWERGSKIITMVGDFAAEFDGETARLSIQHVYPEDEGEYTCVAYNDLGKAYTSACLVVDVPEGKENILSQKLSRPMGLLSAGSTPRSTPRSTPIRSLSPAISHGRELRSPQVLLRNDTSKRSRVCPPKFYAVPHNRLVQEGETVRFQCAVVGHPAPWIKWDKNGTIVTPSTRISIKEQDDVKILEIIDVMREDAALYRVTAENDFGRIEASARLEVINRHESTSRTIRTRSASPRTHPSFDRSLLPTTSRINSRLQLECRIRGTPSVTSTWYRNGRPLERSSRIKGHFDGTTARIEISKVKASDAGEYTCVASNILGSTRSSCQVTVLDLHNSSIADKNAPRFLQSLPKETIVMENYCHEFHIGVTGTPPFTIIWFKDGRELPDNDYYKYIIYRDGGIALRILDVRPQDAGEYTCIIQNNFGTASCSSLFAVQDYKNVFKPALQFTKTPLSVITAEGTTAYFCARAQCGKAIEIIWTINGKDARENAKCKIERDGNVSILRIHDISLRDTGEIRCIASVNGKGPSISCLTKLQLRNSLYDFNDSETRLEDIQSQAQAKPPLTNDKLVSTSENMAKLSSLKCRRHHEKSLTHTRSSSFPRYIASYTKHISHLPIRKRNSNNASIDVQNSQFVNDLSIQKIVNKNIDNNLELSKIKKLLSSVNTKNITDTTIKLLSPKRTEQICNQNINSVPNKQYVTSRLEELVKAAIIKKPTNISVFRGNRAILKVTYQGYPEPTIKWLRVNRELQPSEKIKIVSRDGVSYLTLDDVTYDYAGKYEVSVENPLGKDQRFFSLAVEGPPEPLTDKPNIILSAGQITIIWRSPPYDGGRTVIGYTVEAKQAGKNTWMIIAKCHSLSYTLATTKRNSVIPGESYYFRIRAENIHGLSDSGMESDSVRIPEYKEMMLQEEEEDEFNPNFESRLVVPEEGKLFDERYDVLEELGKGRYGVVRKVIERSTGINFAAKFVKIIKTKVREQVREEIEIMNTLRHPKLLLLAAAYESPRETVLIMEYISGGELFERVVADDFTLTERDSILFMRQICQGVEYMHQNKIVHLDLKPENIMCHTRTSHRIKLIDFGLARILKSDTPVRVLFGTPEFIPPEIINYEPIGTESDMWSIGVICYVLLTGLSPFMGDNDIETFANITRADYDLEDEAFDAISNDAKNFISGLLIKRKDSRMSATQCLKHPWIIQEATTMSKVVLPTEKLKKFIIRRKWQKTGNAIRALGRMVTLSAHNKHSPTTRAVLSPTLEQQFDSTKMKYSDEIKSISTAINKDIENVETSTKKNCAKAISQTNLNSTCVKEVNVMQKTLTENENNSNDFSKQISTRKEMFKLHKLIPKTADIPQNFTAYVGTLAEKNENEESDKEVINKSFEIEHIPKSQTLPRMFRGDLHDSGISDCGSSLMTPSVHVEPGIVSTIKEEIDHEGPNRESKQILKNEDNRRSSTVEILVNLVQSKKTFPYDTEIIADGDKVATKHNVTKASFETNPVQKVINKNTDARILIKHNHDKFRPTGNVSRTAKIFERKNKTLNSNNSQVSMTQCTYSAAIITEKPPNERIQKAFAFWKK